MPDLETAKAILEAKRDEWIKKGAIAVGISSTNENQIALKIFLPELFDEDFFSFFTVESLPVVYEVSKTMHKFPDA